MTNTSKKRSLKVQQSMVQPEARIFQEALTKHFWKPRKKLEVGVCIMETSGKVIDTAGHFHFHFPFTSHKNVLLFLQDYATSELVDQVELFVLQESEGDLFEFEFSSEREDIHVSLFRLSTPKELFVCVSCKSGDEIVHTLPDRTKEVCDLFLENTFDMVVRVDNQDRIVYCNTVFMTKLGYDSLKHYQGQSINRIFTPDYQLLKKRLMKKGTVRKLPVAIQKVDGSVLYGLANGATQLNSNNEWEFNWTILSDWYQSEQEKIREFRKEELDKVNLEMERFLYRASHDLRAPIASIGGLMNLIKMQEVNETVAQYIVDVDRSVQKLENAIKGIIGFSKTKYQDARSEPIRFHDLVKGVIDSFSEVDDFDKTHFDVKILDNISFSSDRDRLEIVLCHLLRNCLDFRDPRKEESFVTVIVKTTEKQLVMEISDNGTGIEREHIPFIFDMFYRASEISKGAGLGLYIVKEGLERMGGKIAVNSQIGVGTTFRISVPNRQTR